MTKKEQKNYERKIDEIADNQLMSAYQKAIEITDGVYLDILFRMRSKIDAQISSIQQRKTGNK